MPVIYIKDLGQPKEQFRVLQTSGNPIPTNAVVGNLVEIGTDGRVKDSGINAQELKKSVSDGKMLLADAITQKGVETNADDSFETMASNIGEISTGMLCVGETRQSVVGTYTISIPEQYNMDKIAVVAGQHQASDVVPYTVTIDKEQRTVTLNITNGGNYVQVYAYYVPWCSAIYHYSVTSTTASAKSITLVCDELGSIVPVVSNTGNYVRHTRNGKIMNFRNYDYYSFLFFPEIVF